MNEPGPVEAERRRLLTWLWRLPVVAAIAGASWGGWRAYRVHFSKPGADPTPEFIPAEPQEIAELSSFASPWSYRNFMLGGTPAIALRVPQAVAGGLDRADGEHYVAFSRVCTHLGCPVNFTDDLETLALAFNFRTDNPALACPCHLSAFAPLQAGRAVSGPAVLPLPRVRLESREGRLYATGLEKTES